MPKYRVLHHLMHNGKPYEPGDKVEMSVEEAKVNANALENAPEEKEVKEEKKGGGR